MLRPYQMAAIAAVRDAVRAGDRRVCLVIPTGGGKTKTAAEIIRSAVAKGGRVLFLVHRNELADQAVEVLKGLGLSVGCMCASAYSAPQPFAPVQVASLQTLIARKARPPAALVVFDECHHAVAKSYSAVMADYPSACVIGLTATPERSDGKGLGAMFSRIVVGASVKQLVTDGHLVSANLIRPARRLRSGEIAQRPVDAYLQHARGRRAIVFSPSVALAEEHAAQFRALGVPASMVEGETDMAARRQAFADLRSGKVPVLCNVYVATEGFDIPAVDCVILARGCGHAGTYLQMVGRALRPAEGKADATVLDLTGVSHDHGHPEDDRVYSLVGMGISEAKEADPRVVQRYCACGQPLEADDAVCPVCGAVQPVAEQTVTGEELVPYAWKRREPPEKRAQTLARWIKDGINRGFKPGWARAKFAAVYGESPRGYEAAAQSILSPPVEDDGGWT